MQSIKTLLLTNWNLLRWLRLAIGLFLAYQAWMLHDTLAGVISAIFLIQAITNTSCCGSSCARPANISQQSPQEEVTFEEITSKPPAKND